MKFDCYTISFCPGSSGRFIHTILFNMIMGNNEAITFTKHNDAHYTNVEMQVKNADPSVHDIYETLEFNKHPSKVLVTHRYPKFDVIYDRFNQNMGVILISLTPSDLYEVLYNSFLKNRNLKLDINNINRYIEYKQNEWKQFIQPVLDDRINVLVLEYSKLFEYTHGQYTILTKLEQFTGLTASEGVVETFKNYATGRQKLIDSDMPWLYELQRNLDK